MKELKKWNELEYEREDMVEKVVEEYFLNWKMAFEKNIPLIRVKMYETTTGKYISRLNYHFKNTDETVSKLVFEGESPQLVLQRNSRWINKQD